MRPVQPVRQWSDPRKKEEKPEWVLDVTVAVKLAKCARAGIPTAKPSCHATLIPTPRLSVLHVYADNRRWPLSCVAFGRIFASAVAPVTARYRFTLPENSALSDHDSITVMPRLILVRDPGCLG